MIQQGVDQGAVGVARGGMHHHALGLDHHGQMRVLVKHGERDILGLHAGGPQLRHFQRDHRAGVGLAGGLGFRFAVDGHGPLADQLRRPGAAEAPVPG